MSAIRPNRESLSDEEINSEIPSVIYSPEFFLTPFQFGSYLFCNKTFFCDEQKKSLYDVLGIPSDSSMDSVKKAYWIQARRWHPDKHTDIENEEKLSKIINRFKAINNAGEILRNQDLKDKYDRERQTSPSSTFNEATAAASSMTKKEAIGLFLKFTFFYLKRKFGRTGSSMSIIRTLGISAVAGVLGGEKGFVLGTVVHACFDNDGRDIIQYLDELPVSSRQLLISAIWCIIDDKGDDDDVVVSSDD